MNRIDQMFEEKRARGECALIIYVTGGYPDMAATERAIDALAEGGADLIELGMPFSDPIADGPTIQHAMQIALERGATVKSIIDLAARVRAKHPRLPIVLFGAYNPILHRGVAHFIGEASAAGVDGVLIPDLPPELAGELREAALRADLSTVFLIAPTTSEARARRIAEASTGFIYYVSLRGVTGTQAVLPADVEAHLRALKALTPKPLAVGFGISTPDQARAIAVFADAVVVGSALVKLLGDDPNAPGLAARAADFTKSLAAAMARPQDAVQAGRNA